MADRLKDNHYRPFANEKEYQLACEQIQVYNVGIFVDDVRITGIIMNEETFIDYGITCSENMLENYYGVKKDWKRIERIHLPNKEIRFYTK